MDIKEKHLLKLRLKQELDVLLAELTKCMSYLPNYWYNLKIFTHNLHAVCRLLNMFLQIYRHGSTAQRCDYHNLVYGPRSVVQNMAISSHLLKFIDLQLSWVWVCTQMSNDIKLQNNAMFVYKRVIRNFDRLLWHEDVSS